MCIYSKYATSPNHRHNRSPYTHSAALAPFIANMTVGVDKYKWILYGDDDTVFNIDNVLRLVNGLNASNPYLLTDALWFPQGITGVWVVVVVYMVCT